MTVCGWMPPCHEGAAGCRLDRHLLSISSCTSSSCDTSSHVFIVKLFSRSRVLQKNIIISHGRADTLTAAPSAAFRRLKKPLLSKEAWQQVTRIEDLCHTHFSHKWLHLIDACAGSVLAPHNYTNVQKDCGQALVSTEATRGHYACVDAVVCSMKLTDPGVTTGLTATQSRPADLFSTAAVPGRSAALDVCGLLHCRARGDAAQAALDQTFSHRDEISVLRKQGIHLLRTQPSREHCSPPLTTHPAATASRCQRTQSSAGGNTNFKLLFCDGEQP